MRRLPLLLALTLPTPVLAQGIMIPRCPVPRADGPVIECLPMRAAVARTRSDVKVELRDGVLRYEVEERFINRGGTLDVDGLMFANRSTWAHVVEAAAEVLAMPVKDLLDEPELAAVQGRSDPVRLWRSGGH